MGTKRKRTDFKASQSDLNSSRKHSVDPQYGQRHAFPGLEDSDIEPEDEVSVEAIKYLRSVRAEARGLPGLLVSNTQLEGDEGRASHAGGFYADGAYIAAPGLEDDLGYLHESLEPLTKLDNDDDDVHDIYEDESVEQSSLDPSIKLVEAQDAYHQSLLKRYKVFRSVHDSFVTESQEALDPETYPTSFELDAPAAIEDAKWSRIFKTVNPKPSQLNTMSLETVIELLKRLPSTLRRKHWFNEDGKAGQTISLWIWCLLGYLPELGTMSSEEVAVVRDLAKRASGVAMGLDKNEVFSQIKSEGEGKDTENGNGDFTETKDITELSTCGHFSDNIEIEKNKESFEDDGAAPHRESNDDVQDAKAALLSDLAAIEQGEHSPRTMQIVPNTERQQLPKEDHLVATLDMILTIAGECYGQRDLLIDRERLWIQKASRQ